MTDQRPNQPFGGGLQLPIYLYLTLPLAALGGALELAMPGCRGQVGFVLMLAPTLMAAFDGGLRSALLTAGVGALGIVGGSWVVQSSTAGGLGDFASALLPVVWAAVLLGCGVWAGKCLDVLRRRVDDLQSRCVEHERSIYQMYRDSSQEAEAAEQERLRRQQADAQRVDHSRLLLNIQHLGRELSGNLDMNAVFRLVTEAARKLLKAPRPRLFLLDEQAQELIECTPESAAARQPADRGMLGWVTHHGQIITAEDVAKNHALAELRTQDLAVWHACAPLIVGQRVLGVLGIEAIEQEVQDFDRLLYIVANFSAVALNNGRLFQQVEQMARMDGLTGLLNHATFQSKLAELCGEAARTGRPLSVVLSDIDHFKQFNDRYGHQAGDYVLRSVAQLWKRSIPDRAIAARYGGEEFICVFQATDLEEAAQHAEALRFTLEHAELQFDATPLQVTASFGVATLPVHADSPNSLIQQADQALYAAKHAGRNRVCLATAKVIGQTKHKEVVLIQLEAREGLNEPR